MTQLHAIDHPAGLNENNVSFTLSYTVLDHDRDRAPGSLTINVNDDTPTVSANAAVQLDDDALTGGNPGGVGDVTPDTANTTGVLAHSYGADGAGSTLLTAAGAILPADFSASVNGTGTVLTIHQISTNTDVIQVTLSNTTAGAYTVTQLHAIDHPAGLNENDLAFTVNYVTTDHDNDPATGSLTINVNDDTPTTSANLAVQLDDDALAGGNPGGVGDVTPDTANTTGVLAHSYGADGAGSTLLTGAGLPTSSATEGAFIQAVTNGGQTLTISQIQNGVVVGVVQVQLSNTTAGSYTVTQLHAIDHPAEQNENNVSFTLSYTVTDHDNDPATGSLTINVNDDTPVANTVAATPVLDDDAQPLFPGNPDGTGDVADATVATGVAGALFSAGADGLQSISFTPDAALKAIFKDATGLAAQESLTYATTTAAGGHTILTATGATSGHTVFTLDVAADGSYTFTALEPLVHPTNSATEENLGVAIGFTVTDGDGDTATGQLTVNVNDDTPVANTVTAAPVLDDEAQTLFPGNSGGDGRCCGCDGSDGWGGRAVQRGRGRSAVDQLHQRLTL